MSHPSIDELVLAKRAPEVERHLATCSTCRTLAALAGPSEPGARGGCDAAFDALLARQPSLTPSERALLDAHVSDCADCRELARLAAPEAAEDLPELPTIDPSLYVKEAEVGAGGMGRTWRARDRRLGRIVALKELRDRALRPRFENEARLTAGLQHPAIIGVHEAGRWPDGSPFYAMDLVEGTPLDVRIAEATGLRERLALLPALITVAEAIAYAHERRIVHRDVKPQNILLGAFGESVLIDWGLARRLDEDEPPLPAGAAEAPSASDWFTVVGAGTPQYMPPEQARGELPSERIDVYALGATLYHLLSGSPPYGGSDPRMVRERLLAGPPDALPSAVPRELASVVMKAMARDPAARFGSAKELADELRRFQTGRMLSSHKYSRRELLRHWWSKSRKGMRTALVAVAAALIAVALSIGRLVRDRVHADRTNRVLLVAMGRQELLSGKPMEALAFLAAAERAGVRGPEVFGLVGDAAHAAGVAALPADDPDALTRFVRERDPWRVEGGRLIQQMRP